MTMKTFFILVGINVQPHVEVTKNMVVAKHNWFVADTTFLFEIVKDLRIV